MTAQTTQPDKLAGRDNQAQLYFRWGLIAFGVAGWVLAKLYRSHQNKADTTAR